MIQIKQQIFRILVFPRNKSYGNAISVQYNNKVEIFKKSAHTVITRNTLLN